MHRSRTNVLVVDDLPDAADSLAALLALWGYGVAARYCGASALAAVRILRPAAVILDIGMAPMEGFELATRLRELPQGELTAIIAVSGYTKEAYRVRARELGIVHYLFKPADPCQLQVLLDVLIAEQEPTRPQTGRRPRWDRPRPVATIR